MRPLLIVLFINAGTTFAHPINQQSGNSFGIMVDNAATKYELAIPAISDVDPAERIHGWAYRMKLEKNIGERIYFTVSSIKEFSSTASSGALSLHTGIGYRFTPSSAAPASDDTYSTYISNFSVGYLFLSARGSNRSLFLHGVDVSLDRYRWNITRYLLVDVGLSLLPWPRLTVSNGTVSSVVNPFLYALRYSIGLTFSTNISALFVHETFGTFSGRNGAGNFRAAFNGIALRALF